MSWFSYLDICLPPIVETLDNQVNWCGEKEWQANKLDAMEPIHEVFVFVEALWGSVVQVDALLDEVWVIFGLVDDDRADAETENQEDDESKYWGVYGVLENRIKMYENIFDVISIPLEFC